MTTPFSKHCYSGKTKTKQLIRLVIIITRPFFGTKRSFYFDLAPGNFRNEPAPFRQRAPLHKALFDNWWAGRKHLVVIHTSSLTGNAKSPLLWATRNKEVTKVVEHISLSQQHANLGQFPRETRGTLIDQFLSLLVLQETLREIRARHPVLEPGENESGQIIVGRKVCESVATDQR
ncbi:hypothetical protein J6590_001607 [Homalodisca vitripennis]|nr:hypothetical protein J6590_001607 [Homalodisca vitripennis]